MALSDETINKALAQLRATIIRDRLDGLEHVEALLRLRGYELCPVPRKNRVSYRRNGLRRYVVHLLKDGPKTHGEIVAALQLRGLGKRSAADQAKGVMTSLREIGWVEERGRVWRLAI